MTTLTKDVMAKLAKVGIPPKTLTSEVIDG